MSFVPLRYRERKRYTVNKSSDHYLLSQQFILGGVLVRYTYLGVLSLGDTYMSRGVSFPDVCGGGT